MEYTVKKCSRRMNVCLNEHKSNFDIVLQIINYVYVLCFVCECVFRFSLYVTHMMMLCTLFFYYLAFHSFGSSFFFVLCSISFSPVSLSLSPSFPFVFLFLSGCLSISHMCLHERACWVCVYFMLVIIVLFHFMCRCGVVNAYLHVCYNW